MTLYKELQLKVMWVNEHYRESGWEIHYISDPDTIFWFVLSGNKRVQIDGVCYDLKCGDFVVRPPFCSIKTIESDPADATHFHYLVLRCELRVSHFQFVKLYGFPPVQYFGDFPDLPRFHDLWKHLIRLWEERYIHKIETVSNYKRQLKPLLALNTEQTADVIGLYGIFYQWFSMMLMFSRDNIKQALTIDERIRRVSDYIWTHLHDELTPRTIANHIFISESYLRMLFRSSMDVSLMEYVRQSRHQHAQYLLLTTEKSVREIASQVGFEDQSKFSRAFKHKEGMSPREYRKASREI
jgi:AraC-like DNA-binding protein